MIHQSGNIISLTVCPRTTTKARYQSEITHITSNKNASAKSYLMSIIHKVQKKAKFQNTEGYTYGQCIAKLMTFSYIITGQDEPN